MSEVELLDPKLVGYQADVVRLHEIEAQLVALRKNDGIAFFTPNPPQLQALHSKARTVIYCGGNRAGKSSLGAFWLSCHLTRHYPVCECHGTWFGGRHYDQPVKAVIAATEFPIIERVIEPKLLSLLPKDWIDETKRTPQGYLRRITGKDGGAIDILSNEMDQMAFESADWDVAWVDEPTQKSKWVAIQRGLLDRQGLSVLTFTPIVEPWMKEQLIDQADGKAIDVIEADTYANTLTIHDDPILTKEAIRQFEYALPEEERATRIHGQFFHLRGIVYKEYLPGIHDREWDYQYPDPVIAVLDPHTRKPHWVIWAYLNRMDQLFVDRELVFEGTLRDLAKEIILTEQRAGYRIRNRLIDPNYGRTPMIVTGRTVIEELARPPFPVRFTEADDAEEAGILKVKTLLHFNRQQPISLTNMPGLYFHRIRCVKTIHSIRNLQHEEWKGKTKGEKDPKETIRPKDDDGADCFLPGTEVLTWKGWKRFETLTVGEVLLTQNLETGVAEYQPCTDVIQKFHKGEILRVNSAHSEFACTLNHRLLSDRSRNGKLGFINAGDLKKEHRLPRSFQNYQGCLNGYVSLPPIWTEDNRKWEDERHLPSHLWAEFMGWYVSEGSATGTKGGKVQIPGRGYQVILSQSDVNNEKCEQIASMLDQFPWKWSRRGHSFVISSKQLWSIVRPLGNSCQKYIPREVLNLNQVCLETLWKAMVNGDGWVKEADSRRRRKESYATISPQLASDTQELLLKLGYGVSISQREVPPCRIRGRSYPSQKQYYVSKLQRTFSYLYEGIGNREALFKTEPYEGMVYCVTVPNHTLMIRTNWKTTLTGNCVRYLCMSNPNFDRLNAKADQFELAETPY